MENTSRITPNLYEVLKNNMKRNRSIPRPREQWENQTIGRNITIFLFLGSKVGFPAASYSLKVQKCKCSPTQSTKPTIGYTIIGYQLQNFTCFICFHQASSRLSNQCTKIMHKAGYIATSLYMVLSFTKSRFYKPLFLQRSIFPCQYMMNEIQNATIVGFKPQFLKGYKGLS